MGGEDATREHLQQFVRDPVEGRRTRHQLVTDPGHRGDEVRDGPSRIHQRLEDELATASLNHHNGDIGDPVVLTGPSAGGLDVEHGEGNFIQHRGGARRGDTGPTAIVELPHAGIGTQQRRGEAIGDHLGGVGHAEYELGKLAGAARASHEELERPIDQGPVGDRGESRHSTARRRGIVMQRGPPPPRTSSPPGKVIAILPVSFVLGRVRKSSLSIILKPALPSSLSVASLRA